MLMYCNVSQYDPKITYKLKFLSSLREQPCGFTK